MSGPTLYVVLVAFGVVVGVASGLLGVGGGTLIVPFLTLAAGFSQHSAEATSLLVILPTAIVGSLDARVVTYDLALQTSNGLFNASFSQYIAIHGKNAYIITFTNRAEDAAGNRAIFDQIAATFALSP